MHTVSYTTPEPMILTQQVIHNVIGMSRASMNHHWMLGGTCAGDALA